ncbi:unnamed protein product [Cunninghamella blakesleeana]
MVYNYLGKDLLNHAFDGYNCCIFAYGQTGSGKTYTMVGYGEDKGIVPRTCSELFSRISDAKKNDETIQYQVEVSYMEIYNEKVRDLLNPKNKGNLKIREHPRAGPYVEDLSRLAVKSYEDIDQLMNEGNKARTVAATNMNETSSRSHAVFTIFLTSRKKEESSKSATEKVSRISLVDLAGSERADSTGATGTRLKEGANINRSLTTLGKVIAALAKNSSSEGKGGKKIKEGFIPYRDSVLTWLLKDSLGGNSRTAMIAAISPVDYDETLGTLRYADQAKRIKNKPVVNEDPNAKLIRELKEEIHLLRDTLMSYAPEEAEKIASHTNPQTISGSKSTPRLGSLPVSPKPVTTTSTASISSTLSPTSASNPSANNNNAAAAAANIQRQASPITTPNKEISYADAFGVKKRMTMAEIVDKLKSSQKLLDQTNQTWEEKLLKTREVRIEREKALEAMGILVESNSMGIHAPKQIPHLVNLNEDPLMTECLIYQIKVGKTIVGRFESDTLVDIRLSGPNILDDHCYFENTNEKVILYPKLNSMTMVNGILITEPKRLHNGYRIILGDYHVFRFNHPEEVRKERKRITQDQQQQQQFTSPTPSGRNSRMTDRSDSPALIFSDADNSSVHSGSHSEIIDWNYARREAAINYSSFYATNNNEDQTMMRRPFVTSDDESTSQSATPFRFSSGSLALSSPSTDDLVDGIDNLRRANRISNGSHLSIDTGIYAMSEGGRSQQQKFNELNYGGLNERENLQQYLKQQKEEYEERIRLATLSSSPSHTNAKDIQEIETKLQRVVYDMQRMMDEQKEEYEFKIKKLSSKVPKDIPLSPMYSLSEKRIITKAMNQWKNLRYIHMAEELLINAIVLKEANIVAKELGKEVVYQFTVVHDNSMISSLSFWESTSVLQQSMIHDPDNQDDDSILKDNELQQTIKPCIAVLVIDKKHQSSYIWSIEKTKRHLQRMRSLYDFTERPLSRTQFNWQDPFYQSPCPPRYTLIGIASVSMRNLNQQVPVESIVDVFHRNTGQKMGQLRVSIIPIARSLINNSNNNGSGSRRQSLISNLLTQQNNNNNNNMMIIENQQSENNTDGLLRTGQQQIFEIQIAELIGLNEKHFTQVHAQFRLSSFGNVPRNSHQDKIYATEPMNNFGNHPILFNYSQTLATTITDNMLNTLMKKKLEIELLGQAKIDYLCDIIEQHIESEKTSSHHHINTESGNTTAKILIHDSNEIMSTTPYKIYDDPLPANENENEKITTKTTSTSVTKRRLKLKIPPIRSFSDDGLLSKEKHHLVAWVQVCELSENGDYSPVIVVSQTANDDGCFYLRQGIQRRINITMAHDSGYSLPWENISNVTVGNIRLITDDDDNNNNDNNDNNNNNSNNSKTEQTNSLVSNESIINDDDKSILSTNSNRISIGSSIFTTTTTTTKENNNNNINNNNINNTLSINLIENQDVNFHTNNTSTLKAYGPWDSSLHNSTHLNKITSSQQTIQVTLSWQVKCEKVTEPLIFSMDLSLKIFGRDTAVPQAPSSSSSAILQYFSSIYYQYHHLSNKIRSNFAVTLTPPVTRKAADLWRVNTAHKYVRGEEFLGPGRVVRGISLIEDYRKARNKMFHQQQVSFTTQYLNLLEQQKKRLLQRKKNQLTKSGEIITDICNDNNNNNNNDDERKKDVLNKVIQLWQVKYGSQQEVIINHKPPPLPSPLTPQSAISASSLKKENNNNLKLVPQIRCVKASDAITKKGHLIRPSTLTENTQEWNKYWCVLRRPFLIIYQDQSELEELQVIDLSSIRVDYKKNLEDLIQKTNVFAIYTANNSYLFQAKDTNEMIDWISKIDQFYPINTLKE